MRHRRQTLQPIKFTVRFYPGQDDDLLRWLDRLEEGCFGAKTQAIKEMLRRGMGANPVRVTTTAPALDLAEIRQVVEAAVASALSRFESQVVGVAVAATEEDDQVESLLDTLGKALILSEAP
jgi:hypothetical protein